MKTIKSVACLSLVGIIETREMLIRTTTVFEREKLKPSKFDIFKKSRFSDQNHSVFS